MSFEETKCEKTEMAENAFSGITVIEQFQLNSVENLRFLIELEEKTIIPAYQKKNTLGKGQMKVLARLIMKNLLKSNVERQ
jgi:hypothetical protein